MHFFQFPIDDDETLKNGHQVRGSIGKNEKYLPAGKIKLMREIKPQIYRFQPPGTELRSILHPQSHRHGPVVVVPRIMSQSPCLSHSFSAIVSLN